MISRLADITVLYVSPALQGWLQEVDFRLANILVLNMSPGSTLENPCACTV